MPDEPGHDASGNPPPWERPAARQQDGVDHSRPFSSTVDHREDATIQFVALTDLEGKPVRATRLRLKRRRHQRRLLLAGKAFVAAAAVLVFLTTATGWATLEWLDSRFADVDALDPNSESIMNGPAQLGDENFLIVGSDTRAGARAGDNVGDTRQVGGSRSDTLIIAHVPADRSRAVMVSFPRDLQINRPPCEAWDPDTRRYTGETDPGATGVKINTAYHVGGPKCVTRVVQQISGLAVNHFLGIDFQGFKAMVDAVDGVEVCVERPLEDHHLGTIIPRAGTTRISGNTALNFVRARAVVGDPTGDYGRINRQQLFLSSLAREILTPGVLLNPGRVRSLATAVASNTFGENLQTSTLLELGRSMNDLSPAEVTFVTVPTTGAANAAGNEELRIEDTAALFRAVIDGTPLPGERLPQRPPNSSPVTAFPKPKQPDGRPPLAAGDVAVRVLNGSGITAAAAGASRALQSVGFGVVEVGNASDLVPSTVIRYSSATEAEARTLATALPSATLELDESHVGAVALILGPEFDGTVTAPPPPTSPAQGPPDAAPPPALPDDLDTVNGAETACD